MGAKTQKIHTNIKGGTSLWGVSHGKGEGLSLARNWEKGERMQGKKRIGCDPRLYEQGEGKVNIKKKGRKKKRQDKAQLDGSGLARRISRKSGKGVIEIGRERLPYLRAVNSGKKSKSQIGGKFSDRYRWDPDQLHPVEKGGKRGKGDGIHPKKTEKVGVNVTPVDGKTFILGNTGQLQKSGPPSD